MIAAEQTAASFDVIIRDVEKIMADEQERADVFDVWDKYGIDTISTAGW